MSRRRQDFGIDRSFEEPGHRNYAVPTRPETGKGRGLTVLLTILLVLSIVVGTSIAWGSRWLNSQRQGYNDFSGVTKLGQVVVLQTVQPHQMSVKLTLFTNNGVQENISTPPMQGDELSIQGKVLTYPFWLSWFDSNPSYLLTELKGVYNPPVKAVGTSLPLNRDDDDSFKTVSSVTIPTNGKAYDLLVTQNGLEFQQSRG